MKVDYGDCGTSVTTPFVLTPSGSCQVLIISVCKLLRVPNPGTIDYFHFQNLASPAVRPVRRASPRRFGLVWFGLDQVSLA